MSEITPQELDNNPAPLRDEKGLLLPGTPSLNPGGRPKGSYSIMGIIRRKMAEIPVGQTKEWGEQLADIILDEAIVKRSGAAITLIVEHVDGKPRQPLEVDVNKEGVGELTELLRSIGTAKANGTNPPTTTDPGGAEEKSPS